MCVWLEAEEQALSSVLHSVNLLPHPSPSFIARRPHVVSPNFYSAPVGGTCGGFLVRGCRHAVA